MKYVISVEKEEKKSYLKVDMSTGKGIPVDDPKHATQLPNKMLAKAILSFVSPLIQEVDPGVNFKIEGV